MSHTEESVVDGTGRQALEHDGFPLSRRTTLKGLAGAGLFSLVGTAGTARASPSPVTLLASGTASNVTGMGTGPLPATLGYLTGSPAFAAGDYDAYVSGLSGFYGNGGTFTGASDWVWGSPDGQAAHDEPAAELLRVEETVVLTDASGPFTLEFAADNLIAAYVNGSLVGTNDNWGSPQKVTLSSLGVGPNTVEIRGMNAGHDGDGDGVEDDPNPAAVRYELVGPEQPLALDVDVKPGSDRNPINPRSRGVIPVAVYSTADLDATTLDVSSLRFGPGGAEVAHGGHAEDVDGDGLVDLMLHFPTRDAGFTGSETSATLTGETADGVPVVGSDSIAIVGGRGRGR